MVGGLFFFVLHMHKAILEADFLLGSGTKFLLALMGLTCTLIGEYTP